MFSRRILTMLVLAVLVIGGSTMVACAQEPVGGNATEATPLTAADAQAYRWQAMANWYERHGLLNLDSEAAADQSETAADLPEI